MMGPEEEREAEGGRLAEAIGEREKLRKQAASDLLKGYIKRKRMDGGCRGYRLSV